MIRKLFTLTLLILAFSGTGCAPDEKKAGNLSAADISYGQGFYEMESSGNDTWRWMQREGIVTLKNTGKDMTLRLTGTVFVEQLPQLPTIKVVFNGETLDQFSGAAKIEKEYEIPAAKQTRGPTSELRIVTDQVFVPKDRDPKSNDARTLGFMLKDLVWKAR